VLTGIRHRVLQWIFLPCAPLLLCLPLAAGSDAQDFFNPGKRAAWLDDSVRRREDQLDVRLDGLSYSLPKAPAQAAGFTQSSWIDADAHDPGDDALPWFASWGIGLYFDMQNFNRVPFLSDSGLVRSDVQRLQASVLFSMKSERQIEDHDLRLIAGAHFASWDFKSHVPVSLPDTAVLGAADNFYDFFFDVRLLVSPFTAIRAGWMYGEARANLEGVADASAARIARDIHWIFDIELCSLLQFRFRMDSQPHPEYWSLSSDIVTLLIKWLARHSGVGFFDYLFRLKSLASERVQAEWYGLPLVTLALQAENYFRGYPTHTRAAGTPNLSYDLDVKKSFPLRRGSRFGLDARLSVFSSGYAEWHDRERMREISIGAEYVLVFDNNALGNILFDPLINDAQPDRSKIVGTYYVRGGRFVDSAGSIFDSGASRYGYKIGFLLGLWKAINLDVSYASSYADYIRYFAELYDSSVFTFKVSYMY